MNWLASPETDDDLIAARDFIGVDNESAARDFLDAAFEAFDRLAQAPEMGTLARFKNRSLKGVGYIVLAPPFNRWLIFYQLTSWIIGRYMAMHSICGRRRWSFLPDICPFGDGLSVIGWNGLMNRYFRQMQCARR